MLHNNSKNVLTRHQLKEMDASMIGTRGGQRRQKTEEEKIKEKQEHERMEREQRLEKRKQRMEFIAQGGSLKDIRKQQEEEQASGQKKQNEFLEDGE